MASRRVNNRLISPTPEEIDSRSKNMWGDQVTLVSPANGIQDLFVVNYLKTFGQLVQPRRLIRIDEKMLGPMASLPGSWVLTVRAEILEENPTKSDILPIACNVVMGSGGARQMFQVDAHRAVIPLPSAVLDVSVGWCHVIDGVYDPAFQDLPNKVIVTATVQRSFAASSLMTRTHRGKMDSIPLGNCFFRLEPFAKQWRLYVDEPDFFLTPSTVNAWEVYEGLGGGGFVIERETDTGNIYDMVKGNCARVYPPAADAHRVALSSSTTDKVFHVVQELGF